MDKTKEERREFIVILIIVFLGFLGISIPYLIFPALFLNESYLILSDNTPLYARYVLLGITLAAYPFGQFLGSPILGSLSDDFGRKKVLVTSLFVTALSNLLTGLAIGKENLFLLIFSRLIAGIMEGNIAIARAMAADLKVVSKHEGFGKINAVASIAYLIGPLFGGLMTDKELYSDFNLRTPFYFICLFFLGLTLLSHLVLKKRAVNKDKKTLSFLERIKIIKRLSLLFSNNRLKFLMITSTCFTLAVDIFYEFGPVFLTIKWGLEPKDLLYFNAILCLALAFGNGYLPEMTSKRFSKKSLIASAIGLFSIFIFGMILTNNYEIMLLLFGLCGLSIGLAVTLLTVKISNTVPDSIQGEVLGSQVSLRVLGDAIICLIGGALLLFSAKIILGVAGSISLAALFFFQYKQNRVY